MNILKKMRNGTFYPPSHVEMYQLFIPREALRKVNQSHHPEGMPLLIAMQSKKSTDLVTIMEALIS